LKRLARCQPWGGGGHDPVPALPAATPMGTTKSPDEGINHPSNLTCVCE
jgi:putative component of membrane protein insertase Oxa1/YidC/SpoIIIJ protein YidD